MGKVGEKAGVRRGEVEREEGRGAMPSRVGMMGAEMGAEASVVRAVGREEGGDWENTGVGTAWEQA